MFSFIISILQFLGYNCCTPLKSTYVFSNRMYGLATDPNGLGLQSFLILPLFIYSFFNSSGKRAKSLFIIGGILTIGACFTSGSRTSFIGITCLIISLPFLWIWSIKSFRKFRSAIIYLVIFIFAIGIVFSGISQSKDQSSRLAIFCSKVISGDFIDILKSSGRVELGLQAVYLIRLSPFAGWGPGGYQRQLENTRYRFQEDLANNWIDNANNLYLQICADLGLVGIIILVLILLLPLISGCYGVMNIRGDPKKRFQAACIVFAYMILILLFVTGPHIFEPGVCFLTSFYMGLCLFLGKNHYTIFPTRVLLFIVIIIIPFYCFFSYEHSFGIDGYREIQKQSWWPLGHIQGVYPTEFSKKSGYYRWTTKDAIMPYSVSTSEDGLLLIRIKAENPDIHQRPLELKAWIQPDLVTKLHIINNKWYILRLSFCSEDVKKATHWGHYVAVNFSVDHTWQESIFGGNDTRIRGIKLGLNANNAYPSDIFILPYTKKSY